MMKMDRRTLLGGLALLSVSPALADDRKDYVEYPFVDYFSADIKGTNPSLAKDIQAAERIASQTPSTGHVAAMQHLSDLTERGSTGELFKARWQKIANPLIVLFFHEIGYKETPYPGDCTPWCAASLSWCLKRSGRSIPASPASSQSFLHYGKPVDDPVVGDICVFTDIKSSATGHVGIFIDRSSDAIRLLAGNQSGQSVTNCGPGYRQSQISTAWLPINKAKDPSVGVHYFAGYRRPA